MLRIPDSRAAGTKKGQRQALEENMKNIQRLLGYLSPGRRGSAKPNETVRRSRQLSATTVSSAASLASLAKKSQAGETSATRDASAQKARRPFHGRTAAS